MKVNLKQKKKNFTMVSNMITRDISISLKAKGMCLIIANFPEDWVFYEETLQDYTKDGRTAIASALKELEKAGYLYRKQLRHNGRFANKVWIFSDEGLSNDDILTICPECRKSEIGNAGIEKSTTTNTHSINKEELNKKNTQKKSRKKKFYHFVNVLKENALRYPDLKIEFEDTTYSFERINGMQLLKDCKSGIVFSKVHAERLYKKMANSNELKITRGIQ